MNYSHPVGVADYGYTDMQVDYENGASPITLSQNEFDYNVLDEHICLRFTDLEKD